MVEKTTLEKQDEYETLVDWIDQYPWSHFVTLTFKDKVSDWYAPNRQGLGQYKFWKDAQLKDKLYQTWVDEPPKNTVGIKWVRECMEIFEDVCKAYDMSYFAVLEKGAKGTKRYHVHACMGDLVDRYNSDKKVGDLLHAWSEKYGMVHVYSSYSRAMGKYMLKYTLKNPEKDLWGSLKAPHGAWVKKDRSFYDMIDAFSHFKEKLSARNVQKYRTPLKQVNDFAKWGWNYAS